PGEDAQLGLPPSEAFTGGRQQSFLDIFLRMVPENIFEAFRQNSQMLQVIFFGLIFGVCITMAKQPHNNRMREFFDSAFQVMMRLAQLVLKQCYCARSSRRTPRQSPSLPITGTSHG
ncbi:MAG: cation:dicarboxylase symporter family transporter, partial [Pseudomonadota bacterium]